MKRVQVMVISCLILISSTFLVFAQGQLEPVDKSEQVEKAVPEQQQPGDTDNDALPAADETLIEVQDASGVVITSLIKDSAAQRAGLIRGDILLSINGIETNAIADIKGALKGLAHGDTVSLSILRGGKSQTLDLVLETRIGWPLIGIYGTGNEYPQGGYGARSNAQGGNGNMNPLQQMPFGFVNPNGQGESPVPQNLPKEVQAAVTEGNASFVSEVVKESPAFTVGIEAHAIIYQLDGAPVENGDLRTAILAHKPGDTVTLTVYQQEKIQEIEVTLGDSEGNPLLGVKYYPLTKSVQNQFKRLPFGNGQWGPSQKDLNRLDG